VKTIVIAVILSATAAFAAATWVYAPSSQKEFTASSETSFDTELPAAARIAALEAAVSQERMARQLLQEEMLYLTEALNALMTAAEPEAESTLDERAEPRSAVTREERRQRFARRNSPEGRAERLVNAGIEPGLASRIVQREEELQMESLRARYEAGQNGDPSDFYREQTSTTSTLREELGDTDYARYLSANGRSTSVGIGAVIGSSPAQLAGIRPGDDIVSYGGSRVFTMNDINMASLDGVVGENVVIDIVRDGIPMQVVLPRGPLGITGRRTRR
jgi:C-terminal processing protease CtpA/Prc